MTRMRSPFDTSTRAFVPPPMVVTLLLAGFLQVLVPSGVSALQPE